MRKPVLAYAKTKAQIGRVSNINSLVVIVHTGLSLTWSEPLKTGFQMTGPLSDVLYFISTTIYIKNIRGKNFTT